MKILLSALLLASAALAETPSPVNESTSAPVSAVKASSSIQAPQASPAPAAASDLSVSINKSIILEHAGGIRRVAITNPDIAEAVAVSSVELLINGKSTGDTTLILWDKAGQRSNYEIHVLASTSKLEAVRHELLKEVGPGVSLTTEDGNVFLRGTVDDPIIAGRAASIASTLGKVVNLLRVLVPPEDPQVLLKVRFADVDRSASTQLGFNLLSTNEKGVANVTTGQFGGLPKIDVTGQSASATFSDLLNIFYLRPDLNLAAFIQALQAKSMLQMLAEPNLLTTSGRPASFLAGGEFPFPTIQGGASGVGQITIQFKEFGIKLNFLPTITPRGTIHLVVTPEVSSLDYSNGLTVSGYTVPGLATKRVQTEVELQDGQSFVIAGLLNDQVRDQLDKVPGLANVPVLGKLFQSRSLSKTKSELLILVTPELVRPIPSGAKVPQVAMPLPYLEQGVHTAPRNPGPDVTGPVSPLQPVQSLPIEEIRIVPQPNGGNGNPPMNPVNPAQSPAPPATLVPQNTPQNTPLVSGPANSTGSNH